MFMSKIFLKDILLMAEMIKKRTKRTQNKKTPSYQKELVSLQNES